MSYEFKMKVRVSIETSSSSEIKETTVNHLR